jgi:capsular exopolysaccharide synthesis family protein
LDLRDYLRILRRNWILIVASSLLGLMAGGAASLLTPPTYTAQTRLFVAILNSGSVQELQQGNTFSQSRVLSYVKTVDSPAVLQPVIDSLGLDSTAAELGKKMRATSEPNTVLISISVTDRSPAQAAAIAEAVGNSLISTVDKLEKPRTDGPSPIKLSVITPASLPDVPSAPNTSLNILVGLIAGLAGGVSIGVLRSTLDTRIRGEIDLRLVSDAPLLGAITFDADAVKKPLLTQTALQSPRAESFRQLRTNLQFANVSGRAKSVLVTSSVPGEGKSTTATNLAIALAEAGQAVCLIDADLRRPMISDYLGLDRNAGLTTALVGAADVDDLLQPWGTHNLYALTSGQVPPNPSELVGSEEMRSLLRRLEQVFDTIIIDAPPLLPVTDAAVLSQHVGGIVLVVGAQKLRRQDLQKSLDALELVGSKLLGIVMNRLPAKGPDAYSYGYYAHEEKSGRAPNNFDYDEQSLATSEFESAVFNDSPNPARTFPDTRSKL